MAITKVGIMANPPTNISDYTHILAHLDAYARQVGNQGMLLTQWGNVSGVPKIAKGSYISHGGTLFVVDTEDFVVTAPADGTYYLRVAVSGVSLAVSWVSGLAGYTWNAIYNGLYDGSENQILPYMLIKSGATLEKWKITNLMQGSGFNRVDYLGRALMGALTCASVSVSGVITDKNGREVLAMNIKTKTVKVTYDDITLPYTLTISGYGFTPTALVKFAIWYEDVSIIPITNSDRWRYLIGANDRGGDGFAITSTTFNSDGISIVFQALKTGATGDNYTFEVTLAG